MIESTQAPRWMERWERIARWWPTEAADATRLAITSLVALYLAMYFQLDRPEWAGWTVLSVSLATRASSIQKSVWRVFSTLIGVGASIVMMDLFAQSTLAFDVALALWLGILTYCSSLQRGLGTYGYALMAFTVPIVTLSNVETPLSTFDVAAVRCSELLLGIGCAYISSVLVARGTSAVRRELTDSVKAVAGDCVVWASKSRDALTWSSPPIGSVFALDRNITDALTEHPSLRMGAGRICRAPPLLLRLIAENLYRVCLGQPIQSGRFDRVAAVVRSFEPHSRPGFHFAAYRPLAIDRDTTQAANNALRTIIGVSAMNAFWYESHWSAGATATTWTALICTLLSTRPNAATSARNFLFGGTLAVVVGVSLHYLVLTATGSYMLLAALLFPCLFLAALARSDSQAKVGPGFALVVFGAISLENMMSYDLGSSFNTALAQLVGLGTAVVAFSALPPPASSKTRRERVMRRMVRDVYAVAQRPTLLLPPSDKWLARMFDRLDQIETEGAAIRAAGITLILVGHRLLALRELDDDLGRRAGQILMKNSGPNSGVCSSLKRLASDPAGTGNPKALRGIFEIATLIEAGSPAMSAWPVGFGGLSLDKVPP
jgi:uncharacterized membrane protein YccC